MQKCNRFLLYVVDRLRGFSNGGQGQSRPIKAVDILRHQSWVSLEDFCGNILETFCKDFYEIFVKYVGLPKAPDRPMCQC